MCHFHVFTRYLLELFFICIAARYIIFMRWLLSDILFSHSLAFFFHTRWSILSLGWNHHFYFLCNLLSLLISQLGMLILIWVLNSSGFNIVSCSC